MKRSRLFASLAAVLAASALLSACSASSAGSRYAYAPPAMQATASGVSVAMDAPGSLAEPAPAPGPAPAPAMQGSPAAPPPPPAQPSRPGVARGPAANTGATPPGGANTAPAAQPAQAAPMLIYTADFQLQIERERFDATLDLVLETARGMGGYLVRRDDASIQVRVPSARFHESLRATEAMGEVLRRNVSAEDVSEEFHDAEVRLQNLRAVRQRLEEFLRRAGSMAEALQVERELERITQEIDRIEGRMRFLSSRAAFSLVTVSLRARPQVVARRRTTEVPPRRMIELPVQWLRQLGLDRLLRLQGED